MTRARAILAALAVALLCGGSPAALAQRAPAAVSRRALRDPSRARSMVRERNQALRQHLDRLRPRRSERLGGKKAGATRVLSEGGESFILRRPSRGLDSGLRSNQVFQLLTTRLGEPDMVPPAVKLTLRETLAAFSRGDQIMAMADAGPSFRPADRAPGEWLERVPERTRVVAAVTDLLTQYRDRKLANVMIDDGGHVRLIDPDSTFVARKHKPAYRSQFYAGMRLGYRSKQETIEDLPRSARELVTQLASASPSDIMAGFEVTREEASVMQERARDIRAHGLTRAVDAYVSTLTLKPPH